MTSNEPIAKAIRIVLVFSLVFWMSFHVEQMALAEVIYDSGAGHGNEMLQNLTVREAAYDGKLLVGKAIRDVKETADDEPQVAELHVSANGGTLKFAAVPTWAQKPTSTDSGSSSGNEGGGEGAEHSPLPGGGGTGDGGSGSTGDAGAASGPSGDVGPQAEADGGDGSLSEADDEDVTIASYVEWSVSDESLAKIESDKTGVATLTGVGNESGTVTVRCSLKKDYAASVDPKLADSFFAEFTVYVDAPYVGAIEIHKPEAHTGEACVATDPVVLSADERKGYAFWAKVTVNDVVGNTTYTLDSVAGKGLSKASDGRFKDLTWEVLDVDLNPVDDSQAKITQDGELTLVTDEPVIVRCTSQQGSDGRPIEQQVEVRSTETVEDPQGADHHQDELIVHYERPIPAETNKDGASGSGADSGTDAGGATGNDRDGNNGDATDGAGGAGNGGNEPGGEQGSGSQTGGNEASSDQAGNGSNGSDVNPAAEGDGGESAPAEGAADDPSNAGDTAPKTESVDVVYTKDLVNRETGKQLDVGTEEYTMNVDGKRQTVTGRGTTLPLLLADAGISLEDQANIESIEFVGWNGQSTEIAWSDLVSLTQSRGSYVVIAKDSYVHVGDSAPKQSNEGVNQPEQPGEAAQEPEFYENTRFRILFDQPETNDIDAGNLRWIHTINVKLKAEEPEPAPKPKPETDMAVTIDYHPVPSGYDAYLSAVPNDAIGNARFGFTWYRSVDDGKTWNEVDAETVQVLRVRTDDAHIGNKYKVAMETDVVDEKTKERIIVESEPVTISAADGDYFICQLDFVPPLAGDNAVFTARVIAPPGRTPNSVMYTWMAKYGSEEFEVAHGAGMSTLSLPTNKVEESDSQENSDAKPTPAIYIYVIAKPTDKGDSRSARSNLCLLSNRVGDPSSSSQKKEDEINQHINSGGNSTPTDPSSSGASSSTGASDPAGSTEYTNSNEDARVVTEISAPVVEQGSSVSPGSSQTASGSPSPSERAPEVVVNPDVSAQVAEQRDAVAEQQKASTPGARWTEITANSPVSTMGNVLNGNPFAPFAAPLGLGLVFAGGLERFLAFRRQL